MTPLAGQGCVPAFPRGAIRTWANSRFGWTHHRLSPASHKKRIGRLIAALDDAERRAVTERCDLALDALMSGDIRTAMERRGIDPGSARVLRQTEARLAKLVVSPELEAADAAWLK